jgi:hypothetical protein
MADRLRDLDQPIDVLKFSYKDALSLSFQSSLATAGYGTALGVICALHSSGVLEKAFIMGIWIVSFILFWVLNLGLIDVL